MTGQSVSSTWRTCMPLVLLLVSGVAFGDDLCAFNNPNQLIEAPATIRVAPSYPTPMLRKKVSACVVFAFGLKDGTTGLKVPTDITVVHATRQGRAQFVRAGRKALKKWAFQKELPASVSPRYFTAIRFQMKSTDTDAPIEADGLPL